MRALHRFTAAVALSLLAPGVYAQTFDVSETTAVVNTTGHNASVTFTQGTPATTSFDFALNYDPALVQFTGTGTVPTGVSCADPAPLGTVLCFADAGGSSIPLNALPNPSVINLLFNIGATPGTATLTLVPGSITDVNGGSQTASAGSDLVGSITITAAPVAQAPTLTFTPPAPGPVALSAAGTGSIAVAAGAGTAGTTTSLVCTPSAGFTSSVTGSPFAPNSSGSVNLGCTPGASATTGTVSCDPTQSAGTDQAAQVFNVSCPAAPPSQAPTITFTPPAPGPVPIGPSGAGTIGLTAGTGTAGTSTTVTCTSTNGTATVSGSPFGASGGTGSVAVQCNLGAASTAFTVTCDPTQSAGTDQPAQVFNATCPAFVAPTAALPVPGLGNTAKGMLIALLAGLGLFGFAMRRRIV